MANGSHPPFAIHGQSVSLVRPSLEMRVRPPTLAGELDFVAHTDSLVVGEVLERINSVILVVEVF